MTTARRLQFRAVYGNKKGDEKWRVWYTSCKSRAGAPPRIIPPLARVARRITSPPPPSSRTLTLVCAWVVRGGTASGYAPLLAKADEKGPAAVAEQVKKNKQTSGRKAKAGSKQTHGHRGKYTARSHPSRAWDGVSPRRLSASRHIVLRRDAAAAAYCPPIPAANPRAGDTTYALYEDPNGNQVQPGASNATRRVVPPGTPGAFKETGGAADKGAPPPDKGASATHQHRLPRLTPTHVLLKASTRTSKLCSLRFRSCR